MSLAHAQPWIFIAAIVTNIVGWWLATSVLFLVVVGGPVLLLVLLSIVANRYHLAQLCPRCAAATPLDGLAAAEEHGMELRIYHAGRIGVAVLVGIVVLNLLLPRPWNQITSALGNLAFAAYAWAGLRHRPLQPWCPYCNPWNDGGPHECVHTPTPDPSGVKTS